MGDTKLVQKINNKKLHELCCIYCGINLYSVMRCVRKPSCCAREIDKKINTRTKTPERMETEK